jgi:predicted metal-dependent hydrolase
MSKDSDKIALKAIMNIEFNSGKDLIQNRRIILKYSGHFKDYSANVKYTRTYIEFSLSNLWQTIDEEIQMGIIESLVVRMFKLKNINTDNMKLYESFMKGLSKYAKKHIYDPELSLSFDRINEKFFDNSMEKPNLIFANESFRKLGSYEYGTDTIYISTIFKNLLEDDKRFLDYVVYHELLHKKHTFKVKNGRHQAHTKAFRLDEAKFSTNIEQELNTWLRKKKYGIKRLFKLW